MAAPISINANLNLNPASINASAKQVQQALGRITGQASEFQKSLDASTARVFAFGATTAVINGVTQSFKALISTTITVQSKLVEINSILGAGAQEFNKYRNSIFQVAKVTGQSFNTVAEGAAELARQGLSATESAKRLEASLILTRISGLGAEQSVKALTAAMNGFTSAGLTAEQVVNKIVAVDTAFAVSAQDLADGFSRAGSTAEDAGVSFDELLGLITAVEQRTARGGAVIGNAFKSIFTRLSRGSTIEDLKSLGVAIDANQNGVQKLQALSKALENISDPTVASQIKELAGGVFQINVVSAALKDIGSEASVFGQATAKSFDATNEATSKNIALNEQLSAQINSLVVSVTSLGAKIGGITFGPLLKNLVGLATKLSEMLDGALDPEKGNKFVQGLFKFIGGFLSGPGLALFTVAFAKIFGTVFKFAKEGFKSVMQMGSATEKIKNIESGIVGLLQKDDTLRKTLVSTTATQAQKEQAVIAAIQKENALLTHQEQLVRKIAMQASARGVRGHSASGGFAGKGGKRFAAGGAGEMEPNLMSAMMNEARDAPRGATPFVTNFRGSPAVMNTSEMQVRINGREEILREDQIPRFNKGTGSRGIMSKGKYAFLVPRVGAKGSLPASKIGNQKFQGGATVRGPQKNAIKGASDSEEANIEGQVTKNLFNSAAKWTQKLQPLGRQASFNDIRRGFQGVAGAKGALKSAVGSAFEVGITKSLDYQAAQREKGGDFDVRGGANIHRVQKLFGIRENIADFKASQSSGNIKSFYSKVGKERGAGAITQKENKLVAQRRAEERDRRVNPQFYDSKGKLKKSASFLDQSNRMKGSKKHFLNIQNKPPSMAKGSLPNLKIKRYNEGSIMGGILDDPMMLMMMGGLAGTLGGDNGEEGEEGGEGEDKSKKKKKQKRFDLDEGMKGRDSAPKKTFMQRHMPTFQRVGQRTAQTTRNVGSRVANTRFGQNRFVRGGAAGVKGVATNRTPSMRGGMGLAVAGTAMTALAPGAGRQVSELTGSQEAGEVTESFGEAAGSITQFAAAGAMVAGPMGAAAGAALGAAKAYFDASKIQEEAEKIAADAAKVSPEMAGKNRAMALKREFVGGESDGMNVGDKNIQKVLSNLAKETGVAAFDTSRQLEQLGMALASTKKGSTDRLRIEEEYTKLAQKTGRLMKNSSRIQKTLNDIKKKELLIDQERKNNIAKKLGDDISKQRQRTEVGQRLMEGNPATQGQFANLLSRDLGMSKAIGDTGQAKALVQELQSDLAGATTQKDKDTIQKELNQASADFKSTIIESAIFMKKKQMEAASELTRATADRAKMIAARDKMRSGQQISDMTKAGKGDVFDLTFIDAFQKELDRIRSPFNTSTQKEKNADLARLSAMGDENIAKEQNEGRKKYLKGETLDSFTEKERNDVSKLSVFDPKNPKRAKEYLDAGTSDAEAEFAKQLEKNAAMIEALGVQGDNIGKQMDAYALAFDSKKVQEGIDKTNKTLQEAANNLQGYKDASEQIGAISGKILKLGETANKAIDDQTTRLEGFSEDITTLKAEMKTLTK